MNRRLLIAFALPFLLLSTLHGQPDQMSSRKKPLVIERIPGSIDFNGVPDEEVWKSTEPLQMIMHSPLFGKEPSEKSDIRIVFDDKYL